MRVFAISFFIGASLALAIESQAQDEPLPLPLPITTDDATASKPLPTMSKADIMKASRVERAKFVRAQHLAIESWNRWYGVNPGRPQINSGYMYLAPPRYTYRWFGPAQPTYVYPYGMPIP